MDIQDEAPVPLNPLEGLEGYFEALWGARAVEHFLLRLPSRDDTPRR
jgi:hypothetical protein